MEHPDHGQIPVLVETISMVLHMEQESLLLLELTDKSGGPLMERQEVGNDSSPGGNQLNAVIYESGKFYAVGNNDQVWVSNDATATSWINETPSGTSLLCIAFGNGNFVAGSTSGSGRRSPNGSAGTWGLIDPNAGGADLNGITFDAGPGRFVTVGTTQEIYWSTDGADGNWTPENPGFGLKNLNFVDYGSGKFVTAGQDGSIIWSVDGSGWNDSTVGGNDLFGITYGP
jgi:hypothetical protein